MTQELKNAYGTVLNEDLLDAIDEQGRFVSASKGDLIMDSLAFPDLHDRTAKYLDDWVKVNGTTPLATTHAEIAVDLHTSRVVVSRILKQLEKEGETSLHRNQIEVLEL